MPLSARELLALTFFFGSFSFVAARAASTVIKARSQYGGTGSATLVWRSTNLASLSKSEIE